MATVWMISTYGTGGALKEGPCRTSLKPSSRLSNTALASVAELKTQTTLDLLICSLGQCLISKR